MSTKAQIYRPPNTLIDKIGGPLPSANPEGIANAEANLKKLSDNFTDWMVEDIARLSAAEEAWLAGGKTESGADMHLAAINLKGLAATYGYPLIGRLAGSLAYLTAPERSDAQEETMVRAHIDAIRAAVRDGITEADHWTGGAVADELERKTLGKDSR